jgi:hypothetical protein
MARPGPENDAARQVAAETTVRRRHGLLHALVLGTLAALLGGDRRRRWFWAALVIGHAQRLAAARAAHRLAPIPPATLSYTAA